MISWKVCFLYVPEKNDYSQISQIRDFLYSSVKLPVFQSDTESSKRKEKGRTNTRGGAVEALRNIYFYVNQRFTF